MNEPGYTTNDAIIAWIVRGVRHDKVQYLTNELGREVVCGHDCCCKSTDPATYHQAHKDDPDEWGDPVPPGDQS